MTAAFRGRRKDHRLVTGVGEYADDLRIPGTAHAVMVRSPHAHADIVSIDAAQGRAMPGVLAVLTGRDVPAEGLAHIPHATGSSKAGSDVRLALPDRSERRIARQLPLPSARARFVGESVITVVAETAAGARDAAEQVRIAWRPLPAVVGAVAALRPGASVAAYSWRSRA